MPCPPDTDICCDTRTTTNPSWWSNLVRHASAKCFCIGDGIVNICGALYAIRDSINAYTDQTTAKGFASALIDFLYTGGAALTSGQITDYQFSVSPFTYKVTGFGVSALVFTAGAGSSSVDDVVQVKLWDYTAGSQIGSTLVLSSVQHQDKFANAGLPIGNNINIGHIYGIKIVYSNTDAGSFNMPTFRTYIHVEPVELETSM